MIELKLHPKSDSFNTYNPDYITIKILNSDVELEINYPDSDRRFRIDKDEFKQIIKLISG